MPKAATFPPKFFHRIRFTNTQDLDAMIAAGSTAVVSDELAAAFSRGHGLLVASWDGVGRAQVHALGIVIGSTGGKRQVQWSRVQCELPESDRGGAHFWTQAKPTFKFAESVAESFQLKDLFKKRMTDPFSDAR